MKRFCLASALTFLGGALLCLRVQGNDFFVAPAGSALGSGALSAPYDLVTALLGGVGQPGDTFWLRGGDYKLGHLDTMIHGAPGQPVTFRQVAGESARIDGSFSVFNSIGYLVFRDFELYSSNTNRISLQTGVGFNVTDISIIPGIFCSAPNVSFINLVVHDQSRHGIYTTDDATNVLVYGCLLFNNGWVCPDNAEGHGLYIQGSVGDRTVADNIVFNNSGAGLHVYENAPGKRLIGITLDGNVAFNAGAIQAVRPYRDWIVGVDAPAVSADDIVIENNMGYVAPGLSAFPEFQIGRDSTNGSVILQNNYMPLGLLMNNWQTATVSGNLFAPSLTNYAVNLDQTLCSLNAEWDHNTYVCGTSGNQVLLDSIPYSFSDWQAATGFDPNSTFVIGALHGTRVVVRSNRYEMGRANIVVYNRDNLPTVNVDVSTVLPLGWSFDVLNAQDFRGAPILSGLYSGQPLQLPMTNLSVAMPNVPLDGLFVAPPPTGPTFNVFVLLPHPRGVQIQQLNGSVRVYWPVSAGPTALQWAGTLAPPGGWTDATNQPAVVGDHFMITEQAGPAPRFYRLTNSVTSAASQPTEAQPSATW